MDDSSDSSDDSSLDDSSDSSDDSDDSQSYDDYGPDGAQDDNLDDEIEDTQTEGTGGYKSASSGGKSANKNREKGLNRPGAKSGDMTKKVTKAGEGGAGGMTLAERRELIQLREQMAELRYERYVDGVSKTLSEWAGGRFQFRESAKGAVRTGRIALSRSFAQEYRSFMLREGYRLNEGQRGGLNKLLELALTAAAVDLSTRGGSFDQEQRRTVRASDRAAGGEEQERDLEHEARRLADSEGKVLSDLSEKDRFKLFDRAAQLVGYR